MPQPPRLIGFGEQSIAIEHLYLEVTARCNLRCSHCSVLSRMTKVPDPAGDRLTFLLSGFRKQGGRYVTFSGGEPGLRDDLSRLIGETDELGLVFTLFTNGLAVTPEALRQLHAGRGRIAISLDGPDAETHEMMRGPGTFGPVVSSLERAVDFLGGDRVILSCVLSRPLLSRVDSLWQFALAKGVSILYLGVFEPIDRLTRHHLAPRSSELIAPVLRLLDRAEKEPGLRLLFSESHDLIQPVSPISERSIQNILGRTVKVQADGWALPGPFYHDRRFRLGKPGETGWPALLRSKVYTELREVIRMRTELVDKCKRCFWARRCGAGSLSLTWETYGNWSSPCPLCRLYQATLERAVRRIVSDAINTQT